MKKKEIMASEYANKLIAYEGIITKLDNFISKNIGRFEEKEKAKSNLLRKREENEEQKAKLDAKIEKIKRKEYRFNLLYMSIGSLIMIALGITGFFNLGYGIIYLFLNAFINGLLCADENMNKGKLNIIEVLIAEEKYQEQDMDRELFKLKTKIAKMEQTSQLFKEKAQSIRESFDQLENQISLEEQQEVNAIEKGNATSHAIGGKIVFHNGDVLTGKEDVATKTTSTRPKGLKVSLW